MLINKLKIIYNKIYDTIYLNFFLYIRVYKKESTKITYFKWFCLLFMALSLLLLNGETVYCMDSEHPNNNPPPRRSDLMAKIHSDISQDELEEILFLLNTQTLTPQEVNEIDNVVNYRLQQNENNNMTIYQGQIHNAGNPPQTETVPPRHLGWRDYALILSLAAALTLSIYFIYRYWDEIRDAIFGTATHVVQNNPLPAQRALTRSIIRLHRINELTPTVAQEILRILRRAGMGPSHTS